MLLVIADLDSSDYPYVEESLLLPKVALMSAPCDVLGKLAFYRSVEKDFSLETEMHNFEKMSAVS